MTRPKLTDKQRKAIRSMNNALKKLKDAGIEVCGMDRDLIWCTKEQMDFDNKDYDSKMTKSIGGVYHPIALCYEKNYPKIGVEDDICVGLLESSGVYVESGGW